MILGVPIDDVSTEEAVDLITRMMSSGRPHYFATANVDFLVQAQQDPELHRILLDADLVVCDGSPVLWASRLLGNPLRERIAGADLVPLLLRVAAQRRLRVFLLGAAPESLARAAARLGREYPGLIIAGDYSPPFAPLLDMDHAVIADRVREARPDLLLVAFGCPKQEKWISMHCRALGVPVSAGIGASIDFLSGHMRRAPVWLQRFGLEWAFRLLQEPRRLFSRYAKDFRVFGWMLLAQYIQLRRHANQAGAPASGAVISDSEGLQFVRWPARLDATSILRDPILKTDAIANGRDCVLDLAAVQSIDSAGLGFLIGLRRDIRSRGRQLVLLAPSPVVVRALQLMHLDGAFPKVPDVAAARNLIEERHRQRTQPVPDSVAPDGSVVWRGELTAMNCESFWLPTRAYAEAHAQVGGALSIDLSDLHFIDSAGLLLMKHTKAAAQRLGTQVEFRKPSSTVRRIARLAGVERSLFNPGDGPMRDARPL